MSVKKKVRRLPRGGVTTSTKKYTEDWSQLAEKFLKLTGLDGMFHVYGMDPGFSFLRKGGGDGISLPADVVLEVVQHLDVSKPISMWGEVPLKFEEEPDPLGHNQR